MTKTQHPPKDFVPPRQKDLARSGRLQKLYFDPEYLGTDNIEADEPTLFVGNHTRYGFLDAKLLIEGLYAHTNIWPRSLSDRIHFQIPGWRESLENSGAVLGSRENCRALMRDGQSILVFPGGAREVSKGKDANYKLLWQERLGFVRLAVEHGYNITPFASVGADEALSVLWDYDDFRNSYIGKAVSYLGLDKQMRQDLFPPIGRGIGPSMIPRPEKFYFAFGKPIKTEKYKGQQEDQKLLRRIQGQTAGKVNELIKEAMLVRAQERYQQSPVRRFLQNT